MDDNITYASIMDSVRIASAEIVEWNPGVEIDSLGDAISEQADSLVSVYYRECAIEWVTVGLPEAVDYGYDHAEKDDISKRISVSMYFWYEQAIRDELAELLNEKDN